MLVPFASSLVMAPYRESGMRRPDGAAPEFHALLIGQAGLAVPVLEHGFRLRTVAPDSLLRAEENEGGIGRDAIDGLLRVGEHRDPTSCRLRDAELREGLIQNLPAPTRRSGLQDFGTGLYMALRGPGLHQ